MRALVVDVRVQAADFETGRQLARLSELKTGALASFIGRVETPDDVDQVWIDHHAGLARPALVAVADEALARWPLAGAILIHRHGRLEPCDRVLFAAVAASDAETAQQACAWLVGQVRRRAPFWRKDITADGTARWFVPPAPAGED